MKIVYHPAAASLAALLIAAPTSAQPEGVTAYEVISIGVVQDDYEEYADSYVNALDEFGRIVGASTIHVGSQGVVWINGRLHVVPAPPGGYEGAAVFGISPTTGLLVGITSLDGETYPAAWLIGQGLAVLDNVVGSVPGSCDAIDANDSGWIAGTCYAPATAVLWIGNTPPSNIGHLFAGRTDTWVSAINDLSEIVGRSYASTWVYRPYLWRDGVMTDIGPEQDENLCWVGGINNHSEVVGDDLTLRQAFWWSEGITIYLPEPYPCGNVKRKANAINDSGLIVGQAADAGCFYLRPTVWERAHDFRGFILNDLIPRHPDVDLITADDINNAGQIACYAEYDNGDGRGVLVTPYLFNLSDPAPGTAGEVSEITVTGLVPNQSVRLIWGTEAGAQPIRPGCDGGTLLIRDPRTSFEPVLADGEGVARFNVRIPQQASGMTVRYQAVCVETCEISHTVTWEIP